MRNFFSSLAVCMAFLTLFLCLPFFGSTTGLGTLRVEAQSPQQVCENAGFTWCRNSSTCIPAGELCSRDTCQDSGSGNLNLFGCYKLNATDNVGAVFDSPATLVNLIVRVAFIAAGIIVFVMIIYAGFLTISGGVKGQEQAAKTFTTAMTGLVVMFVAYWIVQIIKIVTGADILL